MLSDIVENMEKSQFSGKAFIHHCENEEAAKTLEKMIKEKFKSAEIQIRSVGGLCGFYAERGGLIVGFEGGIK